jgi:hypothetical protein
MNKPGEKYKMLVDYERRQEESLECISLSKPAEQLIQV